MEASELAASKNRNTKIMIQKFYDTFIDGSHGAYRDVDGDWIEFYKQKTNNMQNLELNKPVSLTIESRFKFNENVVINFGKAGILSGKVNALKFKEGKVLYDVIILPFSDNEYPQTLTDIDSYFVESSKDRFNGKSNIGIFDTKN